MANFGQIIGYENIKEELKWYCDILKNPKRYKALGVVGPRGVLLEGEPGVGKSLMSKALIEESGRKSYTLRKNLPNGDFVKEIKRIFDEAGENTPSIVFLDDVDKFANCDYSNTDAEEYVTIQACMDECREKDVFVIATANDIHYLPDSLLRPGRFDKVIEVGLPALKEAERIIDFFLQGKKVDDDVDIKEIADLLGNRSCATLESIVNEAGIMSGYQKKKKIQREDLINACVRFIYKAPIVKDIEDSPEMWTVALHEAGHVAIAEALVPGSVSAVYIGTKGDRTSGFTSIRNQDSYRKSKETREYDILTSFGGKAVTEVFDGKGDVGCYTDLDIAFYAVREMVRDLCIFGLEGYVFVRESSQKHMAEMDDIVMREAKRYYEQAKEIIVKNRLFIAAIQVALVKKRILTQRDIAAIKENLKEQAE